MHQIGLLADTYNNIARFEIVVNVVVSMDVLQAMKLDAADISPLL